MINSEYDNRRRLGLYEIGHTNLEYETAKHIIENGYGNNYVLGKCDCWGLVEWFSEKHLNIDKKDLEGPIGRRHGVRNAVRYYAKKADEKFDDLKSAGKNINKEIHKLFKNPVKVIHEGIKRPDKVVKNIENAVCDTIKFIGIPCKRR